MPKAGKGQEFRRLIALMFFVDIMMDSGSLIVLLRNMVTDSYPVKASAVLTMHMVSSTSVLPQLVCR